jgi:hypothetical protein
VSWATRPAPSVPTDATPARLLKTIWARCARCGKVRPVCCDDEHGGDLEGTGDGGGWARNPRCLVCCGHG